MLLSVSVFQRMSDIGFQGSSSPTQPSMPLRRKGQPQLSLQGCLLLTALLDYFLEYHFQGQCCQPVCKSLTDVLPNFFSERKKFPFASAAHHTVVMTRGGETLELSVFAEWGSTGVITRHFNEDFSGIGGDLVWGIYKKVETRSSQPPAKGHWGSQTSSGPMETPR